MLVVVSPAKRLEWSQQKVEMTEPEFLEDAGRLVKTARNLTLRDLKALMHLSDDLARLNRDRFRAYEADPDHLSLRPAVFAFAGDTYQGLDASSLTTEDLRWAQDHLRILSGLYGVLRPLDGIQPYRLEMGSPLKTRRGTSLYAYWRDDLSKTLNAQAQKVSTDILVNCASQEYFGAVAPKALKLRVISPQFLDDKGAGPKIISFFAKRARGAMARFIVQNRIKDVEQLERFDLNGYVFDRQRSEPDRPVFVRTHAG